MAEHDQHDHTGHDHIGHDHGGHDHAGHGHHHARPGGRAFAIGASLNVGLILVQVIVGLLAGSLALLADAGHNLSDVLGLGLAWYAAHLTRLPPSERHTYGWGRGTILSALANGVILLVSVGAIALEAVQRLVEPQPVAEMLVVYAAAAGIAVNGFTALLFAHGSKGDLNLRGVFLHMAADTGVSAAVVVTALLSGWTGWMRLDPLMGLVIAATITWGTWGLLREAMNLAMDSVPARIDRMAVEVWLAALPGVTEVHDLHIWSLSTTSVALTAHLVRPLAEDHDALLGQACEGLQARFGIGHATLQIERGDAAHPCALAPAHVI
jgi:cobalt-zinc-cadmium efflux system protein